MKVNRLKIKQHLIIIGLAAMIVVIARADWKIYQKAANSRRILDEAKERLRELEERKSDLTKRLDGLDSPAGIEREIRENFSVVKKGEKVITIIAPKENMATETEERKVWWKIW